MMQKEYKLCDATLFYNEIEMLFFRIEHLNPYVDTFFIAESELTFSGLPRTFLLKKVLRDLPSDISQKIEILEIAKDQFSSLSTWEIEKQSRKMLFNFAKNRNRDCRLIFSDIDEIPSEEQLVLASTIEIPDGVMNLPMKLAYRRANWLVDHGNTIWRYPKLVEVAKITKLNAINTLRELEVGDTPGEPGIHLSYMAMNRNEIKTKYESFSHTELNKPKFFQQSLIDICDKYAISHLGDAEKPGFGLLFEVQPKDFSNVQKKILKLNPHWIEQKPKNVSKLSRFYRSILISMYFVDSNSKNLPLHGFHLKHPAWVFTYLKRRMRSKIETNSWM